MKKYLILAILVMVIGCGNPIKLDIEVGQIWVYEIDNPFKPLYREYLVLELKGEWVKYKNVKTGYIRSTKISWFLLDSYLKPNPPH